MKTTIKSIIHNLKQKDAGSYQNRLMRYLLLATLVSIFVIIGINFYELISGTDANANVTVVQSDAIR